jgi:hypothetical protein
VPAKTAGHHIERRAEIGQVAAGVGALVVLAPKMEHSLLARQTNVFHVKQQSA